MNKEFQTYLRDWMYTRPMKIDVPDSMFRRLIDNMEQIHQGFLEVAKGNRRVLGYSTQSVIDLNIMFYHYYKIIKDVSSNKSSALLYMRSNIYYTQELIRYLQEHTE